MLAIDSRWRHQQRRNRSVSRRTTRKRGRGAACCAPTAVMKSRPDKDVLVLRVANRQPFPSIAHHELESRDPGSDRDKRDRAVRILPRRDLAPEHAEDAQRTRAPTAAREVAPSAVLGTC